MNMSIGTDVGDMPDDVWYGTKVVSSPVGEGEEVDDLPPDDDVYVDPRVDPEIGRKLALYDGKNEYLRKSPLFREIPLCSCTSCSAGERMMAACPSKKSGASPIPGGPIMQGIPRDRRSSSTSTTALPRLSTENARRRTRIRPS